jgi:hypothetical protein
MLTDEVRVDYDTDEPEKANTLERPEDIANYIQTLSNKVK